ncbi:MAG: LasR-specific antiactivator QslA [Pseudomonas sp.]|uniref:LasR-specific antiactivator QslA n=1 Tax=Pseudomonas sp. TaxID=306 RepID=UPI00339080DB
MRRGYRITIPAADDHPGLELMWQENCQPSIDYAVACADRWLASDRSTYLWMTLILGREKQLSHTEQMAFEVGFLTRLQQRLSNVPRTSTLLSQHLPEAANRP